MFSRKNNRNLQRKYYKLKQEGVQLKVRFSLKNRWNSHGLYYLHLKKEFFWLRTFR